MGANNGWVGGHLQLVGLPVLHHQVDQLGGVLHEVDVLVHGAVHDQQPALLVRQLGGGVKGACQHHLTCPTKLSMDPSL